MAAHWMQVVGHSRWVVEVVEAFENCIPPVLRPLSRPHAKSLRVVRAP